MTSESSKPEVEVSIDGQGNLQLRVTIKKEDAEKIVASSVKSSVSWVFGPPPCDEGIIILWGGCEKLKEGWQPKLDDPGEQN